MSRLYRVVSLSVVVVFLALAKTDLSLADEGELYCHLKAPTDATVPVYVAEGEGSEVIARLHNEEVVDVLSNGEAKAASCAFRGRRPLVPAHGDHPFQVMATSVARGVRGHP